MRKVALLCMTFFLLSSVARGQTFTSGSTGADGALDLSAMSCTTCTVQLPDSGVFNYTTVNVPSGKFLVFNKNLRNTPVTILTQGAVTIAGTISVNAGNSFGLGSNGGPGGFDGGSSGSPGFGPGGGTAASPNGRWIGPVSLVPIIGGSGGYGSGGGGGGAIVIASSASINFTGTINANGACVNNTCPSGRGSGGAIRLVANSITATGTLRAIGGLSSDNNPGVIRIETLSGSFSGFATPAPIFSTTTNPIIVPNSATPSLTITSIAGFAVPSNPAARSDLVDLMLPSQLTDPISVVVRGHNIPVGTSVSLAVGGSAATAATSTLTGTFDSSTTTLNVSGLSRTAVSTLFVYANFSPPSSAQIFNPAGRDHVARVRAEAAPGRRTRFTFLRADGTRIDAARLPPQFLSQFRP